MWLVIRELYTNVKSQVFYEGSLSKKIDVSQGTEQGRILAPFIYKVYVNGLLTVLSYHCYAILMDYAFPLLDLLMTYLYLRCTRPSSRRSRIFATAMVSDGGMISITLKVVLLHLVRLSHIILNR